ncbi:hypothetical protein C8R45DRAFT_928625 [Mycena sanguinolenta]|nr:hypothetical protein C8R45DRAFT_928625 [Mycena sanguinolenta]
MAANSSKPPTSRRKPTPRLVENDSAQASKRRKVDHEDTSKLGAFLNPFAPQPPMPLDEQNSNLDAASLQPPPRTYMQVPPTEYEYAYTPEISVAEAERRGPYLTPRASTPPARLSSPLPSTTPQSPQIDPSLAHETPTPMNSGKPIQSKRMISFALPTSTTPLMIPTKTNPATSGDRDRSLTPAFFTSTPAPPAIIPTASVPRSTTSTPSSTEEHASTHIPRPIPPLQLSKPALTSHIPKAFTDKLAQQTQKIASLESQQIKLRDELDSLTAMCNDMGHEMSQDMNDIDNEEHTLQAQVHKLAETVKKQGQLIDFLLEKLKCKLEDDDEESPKPSTKAKTRDNLLNNATRQCLYVAMGLPKSSKLLDAARVAPRKAGGSYEKDPESHGKVLRPDWKIPFTDNKIWHDRMIQFIRKKGPELVPALQEQLANKSDNLIFKRLEVLFKNVAAEYRKVVAKEGKEEDEEDGDDEGDNKDQVNRRRTRKARKCEERIQAMAEAGLGVPGEYSWFLQPRYQSTDESDNEDVIDPDTDTEETAEVPTRRTRKPWITRVPLYRSEASIDAAVMERRKLYETNNHGKTLAHPRIRGGKKDTPLPFMGSGSNKKGIIRRIAIDARWLAQHSDQDTPSRIHDSDAEREEKEAEKELEESDEEVADQM